MSKRTSRGLHLSCFIDNNVIIRHIYVDNILIKLASFQISGADIDISQSKSSRGDCVALISGTPEQKRAAENLIEAFILST